MIKKIGLISVFLTLVFGCYYQTPSNVADLAIIYEEGTNDLKVCWTKLSEDYLKYSMTYSFNDGDEIEYDRALVNTGTSFENIPVGKFTVNLYATNENGISSVSTASEEIFIENTAKMNLEAVSIKYSVPYTTMNITEAIEGCTYLAYVEDLVGNRSNTIEGIVSESDFFIEGLNIENLQDGFITGYISLTNLTHTYEDITHTILKDVPTIPLNFIDYKINAEDAKASGFIINRVPVGSNIFYTIYDSSAETENIVGNGQIESYENNQTLGIDISSLEDGDVNLKILVREPDKDDNVEGDSYYLFSAASKDCTPPENIDFNLLGLRNQIVLDWVEPEEEVTYELYYGVSQTDNPVTDSPIIGDADAKFLLSIDPDETLVDDLTGLTPYTFNLKVIDDFGNISEGIVKSAQCADYLVGDTSRSGGFIMYIDYNREFDDWDYLESGYGRFESTATNLFGNTLSTYIDASRDLISADLNRFYTIANSKYNLSDDYNEVASFLSAYYDDAVNNRSQNKLTDYFTEEFLNSIDDETKSRMWLGAGKENTQVIRDQLALAAIAIDDTVYTDTAIEYLDSVDYGGVTDWYIPSFLEGLMVKYLFNEIESLGNLTPKNIFISNMNPEQGFFTYTLNLLPPNYDETNSDPYSPYGNFKQSDLTSKATYVKPVRRF